MGKTYRRSSGDKFERRQRKNNQNKGPKKGNIVHVSNIFEDEEEDLQTIEKVYINRYK